MASSKAEISIRLVIRSSMKAVFDALVLESWMAVAKIQRLQHLGTQARRKGRPGWRHHPVMSAARINRAARRLESLNAKREAVEAERVSDVHEMVSRLSPRFHDGGMVSRNRAFPPIIERATEYLMPRRTVETKEMRMVGEQEVMTVRRETSFPPRNPLGEFVVRPASPLLYELPQDCACFYRTEVRPHLTGYRRVIVGFEKCKSCQAIEDRAELEPEVRQVPTEAWDRLAATLAGVDRSPSEGVGRSPPVIGPRKLPVFRLTPGTRMQIGRTWYVAVSRPDGSTMMVKEKPEPL